MESYNKHLKSLEEIIKSRRSIRSFTTDIIPTEDIKQIIQSAILAPYGGATGIPLKEIRKIFIFSQSTEPMRKVHELIHSQLKKNALKIKILLLLFPFLREKMKPFSNKLNALSKNGISSLKEASNYIIVAERKGFPPIEKQSMAHAMQNMWLTATNLDLGFQLISATGIMSKNRQFLKLLGLLKGEYEIDGCVIGVPKKYPDMMKEINIDDFTIWIQ